MALSFVENEPGRVRWRQILEYIAVEKEVTAMQVAEHFELGVLILNKKKGKEEHSGPSEAHTRLRRLLEWNMVHKRLTIIRDPKAPEKQRRCRPYLFTLSPYGEQVLLKPPAEKEDKDSTIAELKTENEDLKSQLEQQPGQEVLELSGLDADYPLLDNLEGVIDGPVALQRIIQIDSVAELPSGIDWAIEKKFDGWLCQVAGGRIYSRKGKELTSKLPPILKAVAGFRKAHLIGELVYWDEHGKMNESVVTSVAGTRSHVEAIAKLDALPGYFQLVAFDLIGDSGRDISKQPFKERRKRLESLMGRPSSHLGLSPLFPFARWRDAYNKALAEGGEGAVFKNMDAPFFWKPLGQPEYKRVGVQYKLKAVKTDDFIVFDARRGDRGSLLAVFGQLWKGEIVEVGDVDNFSAEMEQEILRRLRKGPFVVELGFQSRFPTSPGKLRDPRFVRFRPDKPMTSVTLPAKYAPDSLQKS